MKTDINLNHISDGTLYALDDFVKADTEGCGGCSACCHGVGELVVLNPFDAYAIVSHMNTTFDALFTEKLGLQYSRKIAFPYIKMVGEDEHCGFLNNENRCAIHGHRPSVCRLFPLGRIYEANDFMYFLQTDACIKPNLKLIKVHQWIGIANYEDNKSFVLAWHQLIKALTFRMKFVHDEGERNGINDALIDIFYRQLSGTTNDFYADFYEILPKAKARLGIL